ncbi:MAG: flagellar biosynthesis anti-sigma factor FlgM [Oscillospiraceae bacterium]|nr:flagellar biosynthesis anti-sigma factor FlgM [Oscillospiraceae bacterium]
MIFLRIGRQLESKDYLRKEGRKIVGVVQTSGSRGDVSVSYGKNPPSAGASARGQQELTLSAAANKAQQFSQEVRAQGADGRVAELKLAVQRGGFGVDVRRLANDMIAV